MNNNGSRNVPTAHLSDHAVARAAERLTLAGLDRDAATQIVVTAETFAVSCKPFESVALRIRNLPNFVGTAWSDSSNGDTVVAVIRGRMVSTIMLRRRSQPFDKMALNVERVVTL